MKRILKLQFLALIVLCVLTGCEDIDPPTVTTFSPTFGPPETLIIVEGTSFEDLIAVNFNDNVPADFNPSFGKEDALLFRVPFNAPLGVNDVLIQTEHGMITFPFRVTLEAPEIRDFQPKSANEGQTIYITGENFFEPLEVLFFDSIPGNILFHSPDSLVVEVPAGVQRGRIKLKANGGDALTKENFFSVTEILINDFDGGGLRNETNKWLFYGNIDQTATTAVVPDGATGNYLKLSGLDPGSIWIGGTETNQDGIDNFGIASDINNTFFDFDISNNGREETHLIIIVKEKDGSFNDFQLTEPIDWSGWETFSIPLNRFKDLNGLPPDPTKINLVKFHLYNELGSNQRLEVNIDNIKFTQVN